MPLMPAKCPECGGLVEVNSENRAGLCQHCGQPFVVEDAINKFNNYFNVTNIYNTTNQTSHNYSDGTVVNVYEDTNKDFVVEAGVLKEYHGESTNVEIPTNVEKISSNCFKGTNIKSITIPNTVKEIPPCFLDSDSYVDIEIKENDRYKYVNDCIIDVINKSIIFAQRTISEFPKFDGFQIETIEEHVFWHREKMHELNLPPSIRKIGIEAFKNCTNLESIKINGDVEIEYGAFMDCKNLKSIICKDGTKQTFIVRNHPYQAAFMGCNNIKYVVSKSIFDLPLSELNIGDYNRVNLNTGVGLFEHQVKNARKKGFIYDSQERYQFYKSKEERFKNGKKDLASKGILNIPIDFTSEDLNKYTSEEISLVKEIHFVIDEKKHYFQNERNSTSYTNSPFYNIRDSVVIDITIKDKVEENRIKEFLKSTLMECVFSLPGGTAYTSNLNKLKERLKINIPQDAYYRVCGRCQYCGGEFSIFREKCKSCGKKKDY